MTTPKFTPGPWVVDETPYCDGGFYIQSVAPNRYAAVASTIDMVQSDEEQHANAHLIASAPDLYAALEALLAHEGHPLTVPAKGACHSFVIPNHAIAAARAALAKARGMKGGE